MDKILAHFVQSAHHVQILFSVMYVYKFYVPVF
jgi:hypothetical protein